MWSWVYFFFFKCFNVCYLKKLFIFLDTVTGFINRLSFITSGVNLLTGSLPVKNKLNPTPLIILQVNSTMIYIIKGIMTGDPYKGPMPNCNIHKGIG